VHALLHDAWHLFTHLDGTLWATLQLLLFSPGRLTREYFEDHRARYMPPFRLYFVISIAFFGLSSLTTSVSDTTVARHSAVLTTADRAELKQELQQSDAPAALTSTLDEVAANPMTPELAAQLCSRLGIGLAQADLRLQAVCRHQLADEGKTMLHTFGALVPKMMFVFLPLMALVLVPLYHSPPRYYVEHLVFFLQLQSALFVAMILEMLLTATAEMLPLLEPLARIGGVALVGYAAWYVYAALHRYYGQSRARTFGKFIVVIVAYLACFALSLTGTLLLSALIS